MTPKNERSARTITAVAPVMLAKTSMQDARARLEKQNETVVATLGPEAVKVMGEVIRELARATAEYNWQAFLGAVFSYPKWREEWASEFAEVAALADLEPGEQLIVEPVAHDLLVEAAKEAQSKIAAEYQAKTLPFCHAFTAAPRVVTP